MSHPVVWFEVMGRDGAKLHSFYTDLFGWKIDANNPTKYGMVEATDFRTFRLDRMERIEAGEPFDEEPGRTLRDYLRNIGPYAEKLLD